MRRFLLPFVALIATVSFASAQSVTTIPVGFTTAAVTPAVDGSTPSSSVVSAPFYAVADFQGAVSSIDSSNQVSISGAAFTTNQFVGSSTATPHLARLKSGNSVGRFFLITANTATQLTLDTATAGYTLTTGAPSTTQAQVVVGDSVEIFPSNTLATLFGSTSATVPFQQGTSANAADNIYLFNGTSWDVCFFNNSTGHWRQVANLNNQDTKAVLPDRGIFVLRRATSPLSLTFLGTVPSTTERSDFGGPGSTFKAVRFPVDTTLGTLAFQNLPSWQPGTSANGADNVYLWEGTTWGVYFYNNVTGHWRRVSNLNNQDTKVIPLGTAMFVVRTSTAAGSNSTLTQTLPYSL
jgi:uncharacterized protein (TIGR02597 family)